MNSDRGYMPRSKSHEYETPQWLFDELDSEFDFTVDVAATKDNAKCPRYYTVANDGLAQSWRNERVWMNPPYGRQIDQWIKKAYYSIRVPKGAELVVGLLPVSTSTIWFHKYVWKKSEIRFIKGRLKFKGHRDLTDAPFSSMVIIWTFKESNNQLPRRVE